MKDETIKILKDTIIQWKKEYDILDSIIDMKDTRIKELKTENKELKSCLQEIKAISEKFIKNVSENCINITPMFLVHKEIIDLITKAESEEE